MSHMTSPWFCRPEAIIVFQSNWKYLSSNIINHMWYAHGNKIIIPCLSGGRLNIKMSSYQYRDSHVKDKTISLTILSLTWESAYLGKSLHWDRALDLTLQADQYGGILQTQRYFLERKVLYFDSNFSKFCSYGIRIHHARIRAGDRLVQTTVKHLI